MRIMVSGKNPANGGHHPTDYRDETPAHPSSLWRNDQGTDTLLSGKGVSNY